MASQSEVLIKVVLETFQAQMQAAQLSTQLIQELQKAGGSIDLSGLGLKGSGGEGLASTLVKRAVKDLKLGALPGVEQTLKTSAKPQRFDYDPLEKKNWPETLEAIREMIPEDAPEGLDKKIQEVLNLARIKSLEKLRSVSEAQVSGLLKRAGESVKLKEFEKTGKFIDPYEAKNQDRLIKQLRAEARASGILKDRPGTMRDIVERAERQLSLKRLKLAEDMAKDTGVERLKRAEIKNTIDKTLRDLKSSPREERKRAEALKKGVEYKFQPFDDPRTAAGIERRVLREVASSPAFVGQRREAGVEALSILRMRRADADAAKAKREAIKDTDISKLLQKAIDAVKVKKIPEMEAAISRGESYSFKPFSKENLPLVQAEIQKQVKGTKKLSSTPEREADALARAEELLQIRRARALGEMAKRSGHGSMEISKISTHFLSLASILRPLSPALSNVAMSAGFAAFSLGPIPAALTLLTSALGGWLTMIRSSLAVTKEHNLSLREWKIVSAQVTGEWKTILAVMGRDVQREFKPAMDEVAKLLREFNVFSDTGIIHDAAVLTETVVLLGRAFVKLNEVFEKSMMGKSISWLKSLSPTTGLEKFNDFFKDLWGEKSRIPYSPEEKVQITGIESIGKVIQESILRENIQDRILRQSVLQVEEQKETNRILREKPVLNFWPFAPIDAT